MCTRASLCVFGAVNSHGFVWKFFVVVVFMRYI